ncbi:YeiH family protein [Paenibacillus thermotolerans]|uniref:YeiH family protein n=1 Tax=Paenibacillus thermotolerans TaxID=3027807 RepID=UPI0023685302|nr:MULTISPECIES: putative sulfate exporter family transporter [unclassified Paenibacillus]
MALIVKYGPGLALVLIVSLLSAWLGSMAPIVGAPLFGLLLGILINNTVGKPKASVHGVQFSSKKVLQWAIIAVGCGLSLSTVWETGRESLAVLLSSLLASLLAAFGFGRLLNIPARLQVLIGVGTGICGGSAIAATSPVIEAKEEEIAYAVSTIFLFNVAAVVLFPYLGRQLGLSDTGFGLWAGSAINDTSSVVAAGYLYSPAAGDYATIVKLVRTTFIIPITLFLALYVVRMKRNKPENGGPSDSYSLAKVFPWFILWFLCASLLNTLGLFGDRFVALAGTAGKFMIVMALTGIGLSADFRKMLKTGVRPILFGLFVWFAVAAVSLFVQSLNGQW